MRIEEQEILPPAENVLIPEDWIELDAAFAAEQDRVARQGRDPEYRRLMRQSSAS